MEETEVSDRFNHHVLSISFFFVHGKVSILLAMLHVCFVFISNHRKSLETLLLTSHICNYYVHNKVSINPMP